MPRSPDWQRPSAADAPAISALAQAFDLAQAPRLATHMRRRPLPRDVLSLVELASGSADRIAAAAARTSHSADYIVAAAELYLRQVVCFPGADPYRILGVTPGASRTLMREHMRALVLWLHPDRNQRGWDAILMQRVLEAWRTVGDGDSRRPGPPRVSSPVAQRSGRTRRGSTYRPTWISQPLPKTRRGPARRSSMSLRVAVVLLGVMVPEHAFLGPASLADGRPRPMDQALVRPDAPPAATPRPPADHR